MVQLSRNEKQTIVKYGIHYILWQNDSIAMKWKINILIEH